MYWMASVWGITLAREKKADWRMVLVRLPMPILAGQVDGVDGVDLDVVLGDVALGHGGHVLVQLLIGPLAVDEEHAAGLHVAGPWGSP